MEEFMNWFLNNMDEREILELINKSKIRINGFSKIRIVKGKLNVPIKFLIKEITSKKNQDKIISNICSSNINEEYSNYSEDEILNKIHNRAEFFKTVKYLISKKEEKKESLEKIIEKVDLNINIEEQVFINKSFEKEKKEYEDRILEFKNYIKELNKEIQHLNEENKNIKRKQKKLENDFFSLNKELIESGNLIKKEKEKYKKLKIKYDETIEKEIKIEKDNSELNKTNRGLILELENCKNILQNYINKDKEKNLKKIIFFGEGENLDFKNWENYEFNLIKPKEIEKNIDCIKEASEVWVISNEITLRDQNNIKRNVEKIKLKEFNTIKSLKKYIKELGVNV